ncbi:MAG TPA: hypothetical protein VMU76_09465 [Acidimicrobiales bacterium]|nr:hypothetical protein [Acidimicrobiales bacterium]
MSKGSSWFGARLPLPATVLLLGALLLAGCSTSGPSPRAVPSGWKVVHYKNVTVDVPHTWTVVAWHPTCGVFTPTVFLGPQKLSAISCPAILSRTPPAAEVVLGAIAPSPLLFWAQRTINGVQVGVRTGHSVADGHRITTMWVRAPYDSNLTVYVSVGEASALPGGGPGRAARIVSSIHLTRS